MTNDHTLTLSLRAAPETIYEAVASPAGLRRWWAAGAHGSDQVGGIIHIAFREDHWLDMRIEQLEPGREVRWNCVAQHEPGFEKLDEWVGTSVSFRLEPAGNDTTTLHFAHHGLADLACFDGCRRGWGFYVGQSLRSLVETGTGRPDTRSEDRNAE